MWFIKEYNIKIHNSNCSFRFLQNEKYICRHKENPLDSNLCKEKYCFIKVITNTEVLDKP